MLVLPTFRGDALRAFVDAEVAAAYAVACAP